MSQPASTVIESSQQMLAPVILPKGWRLVQLKEICELNPRRITYSTRSDNAPTTFVQMSAVDDVKGIIERPEVKTYANVKKGYTFFTEGDILFAKITPCMQNGKHAVARNLIDGIGFGSTEFHVLHPRESVLSDWIHFFVRQPSVLQTAMAHFTGAVGQQRVPESFLEALEIPLPPLSEQARITATLKEQMAMVERARAAAEAQLNAAKDLPASYLRHLFDSSEARRWEKKRIGDVALLVQNGIYKTAEHYGYGHPFLRMYNVQNNSWKLNLDRIALVNLEGNEQQTFALKRGDLLISRVNSFELVGKCAWVSTSAEGFVFENMLIRIQLDSSVNSLFVAQQMAADTIRKQIEAVAKRAIGQASINSKDLRAIEIALPSLDVQEQISNELSARVSSTEQASKALQDQLNTINKLPAALLRQAFTGKL